MRYFLLALLLWVPGVVAAHTPVLVIPTSSDDIVDVTNPVVSTAYYGTLADYPQTYQLTLAEPTRVSVQILQPDIADAYGNMSGIIVREVERGVEEVARLKPESADWQSSYEPFGGDSYLEGPTYDATLDPGTYLIEVSNGDNLGKYVLVVGYEEVLELGYFTTLSRIYQVKRFFGKSPLAVFQSPFYYVPTLLLIMLWLGIRHYRAKYRHA